MGMPDKPKPPAGSARRSLAGRAAGARRKGAHATARPSTTRPVKTGRVSARPSAHKAAKGKKTGRGGDLEKRRSAKKEPFERVMAAAKKKAADRSVRAPVKAVKPKVTKPSEPMPDGQQETFCQKMAMGVFSNYSCYLQAYPDVTPASARTLSSLLLTNIDIKARIAWIRAEALKHVNITLEEQLLWYIRVKDTPVGFVDDESPMAQKVKRTIMGTEEEGTITKVEVETPCKMAAAKQIDKLKGFEKPQELNVNLGYEPPGKAMERLLGNGVDLAAILKNAGLLGK